MRTSIVAFLAITLIAMNPASSAPRDVYGYFSCQVELPGEVVLAVSKPTVFKYRAENAEGDLAALEDAAAFAKALNDEREIFLEDVRAAVGAGCPFSVGVGYGFTWGPFMTQEEIEADIDAQIVLTEQLASLSGKASRKQVIAAN